MRFQVPQFVEVEDKLFWRLTLKQFIYLAGGGGLALIIYLWTPLYLAVLLIAPVAAFSLSLAFYQYNNRPFIFFVESALKYLLNPKLYIWKREDKPAPRAKTEKKEEDMSFIPKLSDSKLKELTWALDIKEEVNPVTK